MKKPILLAALAAGLFAVSAAEAQTSDTTTTTRRRTTTTTTGTVSARNNTTLTNRLRRIEASAQQGFQAQPPASRIDGSVTRAARSGNPLQMVNPFAPAEYGNGSDVTRREVDDPYQRPQGLRLFAVTF